jgi:hypothetical protein
MQFEGGGVLNEQIGYIGPLPADARFRARIRGLVQRLMPRLDDRRIGNCADGGTLHIREDLLIFAALTKVRVAFCLLNNSNAI